VKANRRAVAPAVLLGCAHNDRPDHLALLHLAARRSDLDGTHHHVTDARVLARATAHDADDEDLARPAVVSNLEPCLLLNHRAFSSTSTTRQRLRFEIGRVSMIRTRSP